MSKVKRVFTLRMEDPIFDKIEHLAEIEHRSLTNMIEYAILAYIDQYEQSNGVIQLPDGD